jgi:hypothetical protein
MYSTKPTIRHSIVYTSLKKKEAYPQPNLVVSRSTDRRENGPSPYP